MGKRIPEPTEPPDRHTAIIREPADMFNKLAWDADVFSDIQRRYPDEKEPLAFAAINVCISALSLRNWTKSALARATRHAANESFEKSFNARIATTIPEQAACDAIANTSKHSTFRESEWMGGNVDIEWRDADESSPPGYLLVHRDADDALVTLALSRFQSLCDHWWAFLSTNEMTGGYRRIPEWQQRKLNRIFGIPPIPQTAG